MAVPSSSEPPPWSAEHRRWVKARIDDAAARAREALGAHDVLMVAWFQDIAKPQFLHVQDGGTAPLPPEEVYLYLQGTVRVRDPGSSTVQ